MIDCSKKNREDYPRKCLWAKEKEKGLKFYRGLALIGLQTTGPWCCFFFQVKVDNVDDGDHNDRDQMLKVIVDDDDGGDLNNDDCLYKEGLQMCGFIIQSERKKFRLAFVFNTTFSVIYLNIKIFVTNGENARPEN